MAHMYIKPFVELSTELENEKDGAKLHLAVSMAISHFKERHAVAGWSLLHSASLTQTLSKASK